MLIRLIIIGAIWCRWSFVITPININLAMVNLALASSAVYMLVRKVITPDHHHQHHLNTLLSMYTIHSPHHLEKRRMISKVYEDHVKKEEKEKSGCKDNALSLCAATHHYIYANLDNCCLTTLVLLVFEYLQLLKCARGIGTHHDDYDISRRFSSFCW